MCLEIALIIEQNSDASDLAAPAAADRSDEVAADLRVLLSLRTRTSARDRHLPHLVALLSSDVQQDPDARFAALTTAIDAGIDAMPDADHSTAATALLASGSGRWRPLSARGPEAAAPFGCGWDAYRRRRRSTGSSLLEETVGLLARTMVELASPTTRPDIEPEAEAATAQQPTTEEADAPEALEVSIGPPTALRSDDPVETVPAPALYTGRSTPSRVPLAVKVAVALAGSFIGIALLAWATTTDGDGADQAACGSFDAEVGATADDSDTGLRQWGQTFRAHLDSEGLLDSTHCASLLSTWSHGAIQRLGSDRTTDIEALLGSRSGTDEVVVLLRPSELRAFGRVTPEHGPHQGAPLGEMMGPLVGRSAGPDGERIVRFADGLLISEATPSPTWAVTGTWVEIWEETGGVAGGLGLPVGDRTTDRVDGGLVQQFERGTISSTIDGVVQVVTDQDHYARSLPDDPRNVVLVAGNQWWYVDAEGVRHSVLGTDDQRCAGRSMGVPVIRGQHPAAVATLPAGERFECP